MLNRAQLRERYPAGGAVHTQGEHQFAAGRGATLNHATFSETQDHRLVRHRIHHGRLSVGTQLQRINRPGIAIGAGQFGYSEQITETSTVGIGPDPVTTVAAGEITIVSLQYPVTQCQVDRRAIVRKAYGAADIDAVGGGIAVTVGDRGAQVDRVADAQSDGQFIGVRPYRVMQIRMLDRSPLLQRYLAGGAVDTQGEHQFAAGRGATLNHATFSETQDHRLVRHRIHHGRLSVGTQLQRINRPGIAIGAGQFGYSEQITETSTVGIGPDPVTTNPIFQITVMSVEHARPQYQVDLWTIILPMHGGADLDGRDITLNQPEAADIEVGTVLAFAVSIVLDQDAIVVAVGRVFDNVAGFHARDSERAVPMINEIPAGRRCHAIALKDLDVCNSNDIVIVQSIDERHALTGLIKGILGFIKCRDLDVRRLTTL